MYKAKLRSKIVILTNEAFTSKTCSNCGTLKNIKKDITIVRFVIQKWIEITTQSKIF